MSERPLVVVGAGPAGLSAARELRRLGAARVLVLEREAQPGGIPRHARHQGFGVRDLHRLLSGPAYARRLAELALRAGVELRTETMVTGWRDEALELTGRSGRELLEPGAVVLSTGCRERPRSARLVPGTRPRGVLTTGTLQQLVYLKGISPGRRALVVGAEHVSFSALLTLAHGGASAVGIVTEHPRHQTLAAFRAGAGARFRVPLWTRTALTAIHGRPRVEEVELTDLDSGATRTVACDTVVFTADWIPDHELAVSGGLDMDLGTRGPAVDAALRSSRPGVVACGNLLHGAETADVAALSGRHAARAALAPRRSRVGAPVLCEPPLHWIAPNVVSGAGPPPRGRWLLRSREFRSRPALAVSQDGQVLWEGRLPRLVPGRSGSLPARALAAARPEAGPVLIALA